MIIPINNFHKIVIAYGSMSDVVVENVQSRLAALVSDIYHDDH